MVVRMADLWSFNFTTNVWTWFAGTNVGSGVGVYGTINVPTGSTMPGSRMHAKLLVLNSGDLLIVAGIGSSTSTTVGMFV